MRYALRFLALVLALAIGLVAVTPPARADMGKPTWSPGDYWLYNVMGINFGISGGGTLRMDVLASDTVNVGGTDYPSYRVRLAVNVSGGPTFNAGEAWYRVSDLALVRQTINITLDIPFFGPIDFLTTITYAPPMGFQWPLTAGATWDSSSSVATATQIGGLPPGTNTASVSTNFVVQDAATVSVPAGAFETTPVRATVSGSVVSYWAPAAGNHARQQTFDSSDAEVASLELREYRYSGGGFLGLPLVVWFLIVVALIFIAAAFVMRTRRQPQTYSYVPPQPPQAP